MDIQINEETQLNGLETYNMLVGRNGAGKSRILRSLNTTLRQSADIDFKYISPERVGSFEPNANVENSINNANNEFNDKNKNQSNNFKYTAFIKFKNHLTNFALRLANDTGMRLNLEVGPEQDYLQDLNFLVSNVYLTLADRIYIKTIDNDQEIDAKELSSGEAEAFALACETIVTLENFTADKDNFIVFDEPDVHMHSDLQARFFIFLKKRLERLDEDVRVRTYVIFATHSTALFSSVLKEENGRIGVKAFGNGIVNFVDPDPIVENTFPFFSHPLSAVFNLEVPMIVEGEDDERVWQQVYRSKLGDFSYFPCLSDSVDSQSSIEAFLSEMLPAIYDTPDAVSIRDGDGVEEGIQDIGLVKRFRLKCYAIENLLFSDECLEKLGVTWVEFCENANAWLEGEGASNPNKELLQSAIDDTDRHRNTKIKNIRVLIGAICNNRKPWEVLVGQAIAAIAELSDSDHSITQYLGHDLCVELGLSTPAG